MNPVELILVCENTAHGQGILGEHGLSWWIKSGDKNLLFDTGQGMTLDHNAMKLGLDLSKIDAVLLSHGHYDHTSGLELILSRNTSCPVYMHPEATAKKFIRNPTEKPRRVSISLLEDQENPPHQFRFTSTPEEIIPGIFTTGYIPRTTAYEDVGGPFYLDEELLIPDPINDDLSVYFETREGIVVILGCAHAGVINILQHINKLTCGKKICAVYGGMHLLIASSGRMKSTVDALKELGSPNLFPNHCTGWNAIQKLHDAFSGKVLQASAGMKWNF